MESYRARFHDLLSGCYSTVDVVYSEQIDCFNGRKAEVSGTKGIEAMLG
jgi:hypothetical protein